MALNPITQAVKKDIDSQFQQPVKSSFDFSGFKTIKQRDITEAQPIVTSERYEDFTKYIPGKIDPVYTDIDEQRAQKQGSLVRDLYILPRVGTKIISEVAKMPGELYGLVEWASTGFDLDKFQSSVDNEWIKSIDEAYQATNDELFPVYKRRAVEQGGLLKQITSSEFWATEGADGVGFMLAFMAPGAALKLTGLGKGLANLGKMSKLVKGELS